MEEFKEYRAIKDLLPEEQWNNYNLLGMRDLREQLMLRAAKNTLKRRMYELKRVYREQKKKERENAKKEKSEHQATKGTAKRVCNKGKGKSSASSDS